MEIKNIFIFKELKSFYLLLFNKLNYSNLNFFKEKKKLLLDYIFRLILFKIINIS